MCVAKDILCLCAIEKLIPKYPNPTSQNKKELSKRLQLTLVVPQGSVMAMAEIPEITYNRSFFLQLHP